MHPAHARRLRLERLTERRDLPALVEELHKARRYCGRPWQRDVETALTFVRGSLTRDHEQIQNGCACASGGTCAVARTLQESSIRADDLDCCRRGEHLDVDESFRCLTCGAALAPEVLT